MRLVYIRTQNPSEQLILERGPPLQLSIQMAAILNSAREVLNKFARLGAMLRAVDLSINDDIISSGPDDLEVSSRASISATYSEEHFRLSGKHDGSSTLWSIGGLGREEDSCD